jgi:transposase
MSGLSKSVVWCGQHRIYAEEEGPMYMHLPQVAEPVAELRARLKAETHPKKRQRLHLLYLIADGQVRSVIQAAQVLAVHRQTVGNWLEAYRAGGVEQLLTLRPNLGRRSAIPPTVEAALVARLAEPDGFASYGEIQTWLRETHGITMKYSALHHFVRYRLGARPKVARPAHEKKRRRPGPVPGDPGRPDPGLHPAGQ